MKTFESKNAFWEFAKTVRSERRFIFDGKNGDFISAVRVASRSRARFLKRGTPLFRAQTGSEFSEDERWVEWEHPLPEKRMIPEAKFIKNGGRANPPGFAYLYLATDENTALAEMRPWVAETLTLAIFKMKKRIKLVVCRAGKENLGDRIFEKTPSKAMLDSFVWNDISRAFSRPVNREDQDSAYLPTQILAEAFKAEGFDGLAYQSGLERGTNVVLFNPLNAKLAHRFAYTLKKVRYEFEAVPNYAIWRTDKKTKRGRGIYEISTQSP